VTADLRLRRYESTDGDRVLTLEREALEAVDARPDEEGWTDDLRAVEETYLDPGGEFLVGELDGEIVAMGGLKPLDGEIVAMGGLKPLDGETAEITRMRVDPDHHRRGFGEAVLADLEAAATRLDYGELLLETTARQRAAQGLYEKHGYERTDARERGRFEVLTYRKSLDGASP
jgi:ribosomal protein S18 acetylase RimI-like enzyme